MQFGIYIFACLFFVFSFLALGQYELSLKMKNKNKGFVSHGQVTRHKGEEMRSSFSFFG